MEISERARHTLRARLDEVLGTDEATTLMSYLPPVGWGDVATKRDLDHLADRLRAEFHGEFHRQTRTLIFILLTANATFAGIVIASVRLA